MTKQMLSIEIVNIKDEEDFSLLLGTLKRKNLHSDEFWNTFQSLSVSLFEALREVAKSAGGLKSDPLIALMDELKMDDLNERVAKADESRKNLILRFLNLLIMVELMFRDTKGENPL